VPVVELKVLLQILQRKRRRRPWRVMKKRVPYDVAIAEFAIERASRILTTSISYGLMLHQTSPEYSQSTKFLYSE
jgi:hypothetical protein